MVDRRTILERLRDDLLGAIPDAKTNELAALSRELRQVVAELDGLPDGKAVAPTDEIARRREERRRKAASE